MEKVGVQTKALISLKRAKIERKVLLITGIVVISTIDTYIKSYMRYELLPKCVISNDL